MPAAPARELSPTTTKSPIDSLFLLKALGALAVIIIHLDLGQRGLQTYLLPLCDLAVPLFLMISGYFLYDHDKKKVMARLRRSARKILKITLAVNLVYLLAYTLLLGRPFPLRSLTALKEMLLFGISISTHLWYLQAYLYALLILYLAYRLRLERWLVLTLPLYLIPILVAYYGYRIAPFPQTIYLTMSVIAALPFVVLGMRVARHKELIQRIELPWGWLLLSMLLILYAESYLMNLGRAGLWVMPTLLTLFVWAIKHPHLKRSEDKGGLLSLETLRKIGVEHSANIYYFHMLLITFLLTPIARQFSTITLGGSLLLELLSLSVIYLLSILLSIGINRLQSRLGIDLFR